jgi:hypothetical protein
MMEDVVLEDAGEREERFGHRVDVVHRVGVGSPEVMRGGELAPQRAVADLRDQGPFGGIVERDLRAGAGPVGRARRCFQRAEHHVQRPFNCPGNAPAARRCCRSQSRSGPSVLRFTCA